MRHSTVSLLTIPVLCVLFLGCSYGGKQATANEPPKHIIPEETRLVNGRESEQTGSITIADDAPTPRIELDNDDLLIQVININLDLDPMEEQVLVLKSRDEAQGYIRVAVVDYDSVSNLYKKSWEGGTVATNIRNFVVDFIDVVGDLNSDIVCTGLDHDGKQTMDVFWRTTAPNGVLHYYSAICSLSVAGTIEIQEIPRSRAYKLKQKTGKSFPIITYQHDPDSPNIMDLLKTSYYWDFQIRSYVTGDVERIPGQSIEDQQLRDLYKKGEGDFEQFLSGSWLKSTSEQNPVIDYRNLILFDPAQRRITFFSDQVQEIYIWDNSLRTLYNSLYIVGTNEIVPYIKKQITIRVLSVSSIQITGTDIWQGTYIKLTPSIQQSILNQEVETTASLPILSGYYRGDNGDELIFSSPMFTGRENGFEVRGGFAVFNAGNHILSLKYLDEKGIVKETRIYKFDYIEETEETSIKRIIYLLGGELTVSGFKPTSDTVLRFEQVEIKESSE